MIQPTDAPCLASIIIVTHNRVDDLDECLRSLPWQEIADRALEVIVVDDGSTDGAAELVTTRYPQVHLLRNETRRGMSVARNQASRAARSDLFLYLDDDIVAYEGWLATLIAADDQRSILGGGIENYQDGLPQGGPAFSTFIGKRLPCRPSRATVGTSCNMAVPRAVFEAIDGFDEELYFFEDSDVCIRARKAGFGFKHVPEALVRHKGTPTKIGMKIYFQEYSSTYAMLKAYTGQPLRRGLFSLLNGAWLVARVVGWGLRGKIEDVKLLLRGWINAYRSYAQWRRTGHGPHPITAATSTPDA